MPFLLYQDSAKIDYALTKVVSAAGEYEDRKSGLAERSRLIMYRSNVFWSRTRT